MEKDTVKILCIDGGGVRGLVPAILLHEIEKRVGKPAWQIFDFISGTSIGAPIALMASITEKDGSDYTAGEIVEFFEKYSKQIFNETIWWKIVSIGGLIRPRYRNHNFKRILRGLMRDLKLSDSRTNVMVPSYEVETHKAIFHKSFKAKQYPDEDFYVRDLSLSTTAVPSILDVVKMKNVSGTKEFICLDGGLTAYQMGVFSLVEARKMWPEAKNIIMVSLGTGQPPMNLKYNKIRKWGIVRWFQPLLKVIIWGPTFSVDYALRHLLDTYKEHQLDRNYYRFQPEFDPSMSFLKLEDTSKDYMEKMKAITTQFIKDNDDLIKEACDKLRT